MNLRNVIEASSQYYSVNFNMINRIGAINSIVLSVLCDEKEHQVNTERFNGSFLLKLENVEHRTGLSNDMIKLSINKLSEIEAIEFVFDFTDRNYYFMINEQTVLELCEE